MRVLAGDVGGTTTRLAVIDARGATYTPLAVRAFSSPQQDSLEEVARGVLAELETSCDAACFGVPGPVFDGRCRTTNLPWLVDGGELAKRLLIPRVALLNDLEATAWGIAVLAPTDLAVLDAGDPEPAGNAALIAAGTGLGEAGLVRHGAVLRPFSCEGGHSDFAPHDELGFALLRHLQRQFDHVSWERILSGPGLVRIYEFLCEYRRARKPEWLAESMRDRDPAAVISTAALAGRCPVCSEALDLFVGYYGAAAGNLALTMMATGGLYVGGGIAPKILERLRGPRFIDAFRRKGRMQPLIERMPVKVILNPDTALLGAARYAATHAMGG
jgi:glucokinase